MNPIDHRPNPLANQVLDVLELNPQGIKEYELLGLLADHPVLQITDGEPQLVLFQKHFLLMNALYQLRQRFQHSEWWLEISPLNIQLKKVQLKKVSSVSTGVSEDSVSVDVRSDVELSRYYLDWNNFSNTDGAEVQRLLDGFWRRIFKIDARADALRVLELGIDATEENVRQRYRELAARHHPDKGGDHERFVKIREAYEILKPS